ncbi:hypothetical protein P43SY_006794 [Pythium insidiosum]|uniref:M96 mating-specific protein family n=1 Tax=Pythium insidiosum TaxID=114742 RepID=A0AAD5M2K4_PYTIN|nr:hypothetical protein P43SY_006794 [Pythium insidiosum]
MDDELSLLEDAVALIDACDPLPWIEADPTLHAESNDATESLLSELPSIIAEPIVPLPSANGMLSCLDTHSDASAAAASTPSAKKASRNPSRERLKAELSFLREKVVELENELQQLRHHHEQEAIAKHPTTAIAPVWRRMAQRQLERRRKAEDENARLRSALDGQIRVAKSLEQMLKKRTSAAMLDLFEGARVLPKRCRMSHDLDELYARFTPEIDDAYGMVDDVFRECGLEGLYDESVRGYQVRTRATRGQEQLFVEMWDVKLVPFDAKRAASVFWSAMFREWTGESRTVHASRHAEDSFGVRFDAKSESRTRQGVLHVGLVAKRFLEKDRMVMVWRGTNSPAEDVEDWRHMYTEETGWLVVKRVPNNSNTAVMQACMHLFPKWVGLESRSDLVEHMKTGDFAMLVTNSYENDVNHVIEAVENVLLDESLARHSVEQ